MSFPSVAEVLSDFEETVILKKTTVIVNDEFKRETITSNEPIRAVIQAESGENLQIESIDFSLNYIRVHSRIDIDIQDVVFWKNSDYRIIKRINQINRGFFELIGEEIK